jgi:hypothetical protein
MEIIPATPKKQLVFESKTYRNLEQSVISVTEDKIRICLMNYLQYLNARGSWITPLGIFLTVIITLLTTDFKDFYLSKNTWQAIFVISSVVSLVWLAITIKLRPKHRTIEDIINELKGGINQASKD